jgi:hypothetical protein
MSGYELKRKQLSADQIANLLKSKTSTDQKHEPKVRPSFTLEQYEAMADAYQNGKTSFDMPGLGEYTVTLQTTRSGDWVVVMPVKGHVPMGCYNAKTLADRSK